MSKACETCGHITEQGDGWRETQERRIIPLDYQEVSIQHHGRRLFTGPTHSTGTIRPAHRTERMWVRTWGEKEWRPE